MKITIKGTDYDVKLTVGTLVKLEKDHGIALGDFGEAMKKISNLVLLIQLTTTAPQDVIESLDMVQFKEVADKISELVGGLNSDEGESQPTTSG
jgi:ACT domain-containing protein